MDPKEREAVIDSIKIRVKNQNGEKLIEIPWDQKLQWLFVKVWGSYERAKDSIKARDQEKPITKWVKRILKLLEALITIGGALAAKKIIK